MKTVLKIFGILAVLMALLCCSMSIYRANEDKKDVAEVQAQATEAKAQIDALKEMAKAATGEAKTEIDGKIAEAEKALNSIPSESAYTTVQALLAALLILSIVFAVFLFRPNAKATALFGAAVVLLIAAYFASPDIKRGEYGGANSRTLALLSGVPVVVAGLCAMLIAKKSAPAK